MITNVTQRWRGKKPSYRPAREPINVLRYEVVEVPGKGDTLTEAFVVEHHYLGCFPAARRRFHLRHWNIERAAWELVGVAVFGQPVNNATLLCLPGTAKENMELQRLVLLDEVPANAESYFVAECFRRLKQEGIIGVVSFSDPFARTNAKGEVIHVGHVGTVYQALNGLYLGRSRPEWIHLLPDGRCFTNRQKAKVRGLESGWNYCAELLVEHGATMLDPDKEDPRGWLRHWLKELCRRELHPGNHKYVWTLEWRARRFIKPPKGIERLDQLPPYPKMFRQAA